MNDFMHTAVSDLCLEVAKKTEETILEQLNEFISRGLIVVEVGNWSLVHDQNSDKVTMNRQVKLVLKDKEYIEKLENQVKELSICIQNIAGVLNE